MGVPLGAGRGFVLRVDPAGFSSTGGARIHGPIWCESDAVAFPGPNWHDFPVVVLRSWLEAAVLLADGGGRSATIRFMDGPYKVQLFKTESEWWQAELVAERDGRANVTHQFEFPPASLVRSLIVCTDDLLQECTVRSWESVDIDAVRLLGERLMYFDRGTDAGG